MSHLCHQCSDADAVWVGINNAELLTLLYWKYGPVVFLNAWRKAHESKGVINHRSKCVTLMAGKDIELYSNDFDNV